MVVKLIGGALRWVIGTSAIESLNAAANIFIGQTEAPLVVRPYLKGLTEPQLFAVMVSGVASIAGTEPQPMMGVYCVSKAAVIMMTQVMAAELAQDNVQVNAIAPGFIKTKFSSAIWQNESINEQVTKQIPQHRIAEPVELTGMALYLAAEASSFTTGAIMLIDGGQKISIGL